MRWIKIDVDTPQKPTITNWQEHNGQSAKRRAMDAVRKALKRDELRKQGLPVRPLPRSMPPVRTK